MFRRQIDVTYDEESLARMRLGYLCFRCMEPQEIPMPHSCALCGYDMRYYQTNDIAAEFEGTKHIGPSTSLEDELALLHEAKQRERRDRAVWIPPSAA